MVAGRNLDRKDDPLRAMRPLWLGDDHADPIRHPQRGDRGNIFGPTITTIFATRASFEGQNSEELEDLEAKVSLQGIDIVPLLNKVTLWSHFCVAILHRSGIFTSDGATPRLNRARLSRNVPWMLR